VTDLADYDAELQQLFATEAGERLESMTRLLLQLESSSGDPEQLAALFREAHTLKGGAGTVGLPAIGRVAHAMEDLLVQVRDGSRTLTPGLADAILAGVDAMGSIVQAAAAGQPYEAAAAAAEAALRAVASPAAPAPVENGAASGPPPAPAAEPDPPAAQLAAAAQPDTAASERLAVPLERLDELVRLVGESVSGQLRVGALLRSALRRDPEELEEFRAFTHLLRELQDLAMRTRMVPVARAVPSLRRAVREAARATGKQVRLEVRGEETELDRRVLDQLSDALLHLMRNAVGHGIETPALRVEAGKSPEGVVSLEAAQQRSEVVVVVRDDGRGIDVARVREVADGGGPPSALPDEQALQLIFRSGFSTAREVDELAGRGVGLDVVRTRLEAIQGRVEVQSRPGAGTEFRIVVPVTLAVVSSLLVAAAGQRFAVPMHSVAGILPTDAEQRWSGGRQVVMAKNEPVRLSTLAGALDVGETTPAPAGGPVVLLEGHAGSHAFRVDRVLGQRQVVVKGLSRALPRLPAVAGASVEPDGHILLMLDPVALMERVSGAGALALPAPAHADDPPARTRVLVVDDAMIVREVERSMLEQAGYEVLTASDGMEALTVLSEQPCDLVVSDVDMPRLDGIALTARIRALPRLSQVPIILLTANEGEAGRRRGLEAGADAYVVKSGFDRTAMLRTIELALGRR
jgi:two-component system chemotaxis sensor kinase CheA